MKTARQEALRCWNKADFSETSSESSLGEMKQLSKYFIFLSFPF
jgi:hypothetical protein